MNDILYICDDPKHMHADILFVYGSIIELQLRPAIVLQLPMHRILPPTQPAKQSDCEIIPPVPFFFLNIIIFSPFLISTTGKRSIFLPFLSLLYAVIKPPSSPSISLKVITFFATSENFFFPL